MRSLRLWIKRFLVTISSLVAFVFIANAALIFLSSPSNVQKGAEPSSVTDIGSLRVLFYDDLKSGGVGVFGWDFEAAGYVDMLSPELVIYADSAFSEDFAKLKYLYLHEYAHTLQRRMVGYNSGGWPEITKPIQSIRYYYNLIKLNKELQEVMPPVRDDSIAWSLTHGLEASAECYSQAETWTLDSSKKKFKDYLDGERCSKDQLILTQKLLNPLKWFNPTITEAETQKYKEKVYANY